MANRVIGHLPGGQQPNRHQRRAAKANGSILLPDGAGGFSQAPAAVPAYVACQQVLTHIATALGEGGAITLHEQTLELLAGKPADVELSASEQMGARSIALLADLQRQARAHLEEVSEALDLGPVPWPLTEPEGDPPADEPEAPAEG
ncbi:MAG: hypothetical protein DRQ55_11175 [Planctomycetota bacterium]|nr:MAG: hypothetical protein DRQ55_11175 [Planctomycetota bacterium]RKZ10666.1 MAG: hypothetical protein DRQ32_06915 [bacterium]